MGLAEEREKLRITLLSIGDGVISTTADGRVDLLNPVAQKLTGWSHEEARGRPLTEVFRIVNETTREAVPNPALEALEQRKPVELANHTVLVARDGTERPIEDSAAPILGADGAVVGAVLVFRDVTLRRRDDEARRRLAAIVESSQDAIVSKTLDGIIRSWNDSAERLFGWSAGEIIGRPVTTLIPPERLDEERLILSRLARGERVEHFETVRVAKDGRLLDISLTVSPIRDAHGDIIGASKIARDITARKRLENELKAKAEQLALADREKDDFIALLAHELRNPLAPIRNGLHVMRLAGDDVEKIASVREVMDRQLAHMVRLIDDLLDVSRMKRHKLHLQKRSVPLAEVVSHAVETARPLIDAGGHQLTVSLPDAPVLLEADLSRVSQVISNLLTNSAKYTERGGRIALSAALERGDVVISVKDNGIGIPEAALPRVFDMFAQVGRPLEQSTGGLGIGLALVKGLTEAHGGSVSAQSGGPGSGSTFTVRLPVLPAEAPAPRAAESGSGPRPGAARKLCVVVADDNADGAASMADLLELFGHQVHVAHDGEQVLLLVEKLKPDLVLMDVGMPKLNGLDATRKIRAQPWGGRLSIVALTGWGKESDRERSREAGCDGHLVKPVGVAQLEELIARVSRAPRVTGQ